MMGAASPVFDTGVGHNLLRRDALSANCLRHDRVIQGPVIKDSEKRRIKINADIDLTLPVSTLITWGDFAICEELSVPWFLRCKFIDLHVESFVPGDEHLSLTDDAGAQGHTSIIRDLTLDGSHAEMAAVYHTRVTKSVILSEKARLEPLPETCVPVNCALQGTSSLACNLRHDARNGLNLANGLINVTTQTPSFIVVSNYRSLQVTFLQETALRRASISDENILSSGAGGLVPPGLDPSGPDIPASGNDDSEIQPSRRNAENWADVADSNLRHLQREVAADIRATITKKRSMRTGGALGTRWAHPSGNRERRSSADVGDRGDGALNVGMGSSGGHCPQEGSNIPLQRRLPATRLLH